MHPEISVVLPTYNRREQLEKAVDSVLKQSLDDLELLIVDDGSTDGTEDYVRSLSDSRVVYTGGGENQGAAAARNKGAAFARGDYLAFQDSDTVWLMDKLKKQVSYMKGAGRNTAMVYSPFRKICGNYRVDYPGSDIPARQKEGDIFRFLLLKPLVDTPTMLIRREIFEELGGFRQELKSLEDYEFSLRVAKDHGIGFIGEPLIISYENPGSVGNNGREDIKSRFFILEEFDSDYERFGLKEEYLQEMLRIAQQNGEFATYALCMRDYLTRRTAR